MCLSPTLDAEKASQSLTLAQYIFDARRFDRASNVLKGHVHAVMDVEFSPTGEKLVSASYDRTVRIFSKDHGQSVDVYHTKRMQRVVSLPSSLMWWFVPPSLVTIWLTQHTSSEPPGPPIPNTS